MEGQENALVMAEEMIPQLVGRGTRGMIVSSGRELLQSDLTDDPDELLEFLRRIRHDPLQWGEVAYAEGEWEPLRRYLRSDQRPGGGKAP